MRSAPSRSAVRAAAAALVALALPVAGCAGPQGGPPSAPPASTTTAVSTASSPSPSTANPDPGLSGASTAPVSRPAASGSLGLLVDARLAGHDGYDRFVLEFRDAVPGYQVGYATLPVVSDPAGEEVPLAGDHALAIRLEPASGFDLVGTSGATYTGPDRIASDTAAVLEAVLVGDFEAVMTWVLGIDGEAPFVVTELSSPPRLVIDVVAP